jgi:hypothetical protein
LNCVALTRLQPTQELWLELDCDELKANLKIDLEKNSVALEKLIVVDVAVKHLKENYFRLEKRIHDFRLDLL